MSQLETQVARLRAQVERGEATRQTLEYDIAVATRDSASDKSKAEAMLTGLQKENQELKGACGFICVCHMHESVCKSLVRIYCFFHHTEKLSFMFLCIHVCFK